MSKFEKSEPKVMINVRVEKETLERAKAKNINVSAVCRYALELAIAGKLYKEKQGA